VLAETHGSTSGVHPLREIVYQYMNINSAAPPSSRTLGCINPEARREVSCLLLVSRESFWGRWVLGDRPAHPFGRVLGEFGENLCRSSGVLGDMRSHVLVVCEFREGFGVVVASHGKDRARGGAFRHGSKTRRGLPEAKGGASRIAGVLPVAQSWSLLLA